MSDLEHIPGLSLCFFPPFLAPRISDVQYLLEMLQGVKLINASESDLELELISHSQSMTPNSHSLKLRLHWGDDGSVTLQVSKSVWLAHSGQSIFIPGPFLWSFSLLYRVTTPIFLSLLCSPWEPAVPSKTSSWSCSTVTLSKHSFWLRLSRYSTGELLAFAEPCRSGDQECLPFYDGEGV